jgi:hypothetical protein
MPVQVKVNFDEGDTVVTVFNDKREQYFNFTVKNKPIDIVIDPENFILNDINSISGVNDPVVKDYKLKQNFPNPFNPSTNIEFYLPEAGKIKLEVFNQLGEKVKTIIDERRSAGSHSAEFKADDLSSGIYYYRLTADKFVQTKKMALIR